MYSIIGLGLWRNCYLGGGGLVIDILLYRAQQKLMKACMLFIPIVQ